MSTGQNVGERSVRCVLTVLQAPALWVVIFGYTEVIQFDSLSPYPTELIGQGHPERYEVLSVAFGTGTALRIGDQSSEAC